MGRVDVCSSFTLFAMIGFFLHTGNVSNNPLPKEARETTFFHWVFPLSFSVRKFLSAISAVSFSPFHPFNSRSTDVFLIYCPTVFYSFSVYFFGKWHCSIIFVHLVLYKFSQLQIATSWSSAPGFNIFPFLQFFVLWSCALCPSLQGDQLMPSSTELCIPWSWSGLTRKRLLHKHIFCEILVPMLDCAALLRRYVFNLIARLWAFFFCSYYLQRSADFIWLWPFLTHSHFCLAHFSLVDCNYPLFKIRASCFS